MKLYQITASTCTGFGWRDEKLGLYASRTKAEAEAQRMRESKKYSIVNVTPITTKD